MGSVRQGRWGWGGLVLGRPIPSPPHRLLLAHSRCLQALRRTGLNMSQLRWSLWFPPESPPVQWDRSCKGWEDRGGGVRRASLGRRGFLAPAISQGTHRYTVWPRVLPTGCSFFGHDLNEHHPQYFIFPLERVHSEAPRGEGGELLGTEIRLWGKSSG